MIRKAVIHSQVLSGLRTRYTPRSRIGQGVISLAPWLNLVLLIAFFLLLDSKVVLQPGVDLRLPEAPFTDGSPSGLPVVVLSISSPAGPREEIVVFDDERFLVADRSQMERFRERVAARAAGPSALPLVIHADSRVSHGTVLGLVNTARDAGVREISISVRDSAAPEGREKTP